VGGIYSRTSQQRTAQDSAGEAEGSSRGSAGKAEGSGLSLSQKVNSSDRRRSTHGKHATQAEADPRVRARGAISGSQPDKAELFLGVHKRGMSRTGAGLADGITGLDLVTERRLRRFGAPQRSTGITNLGCRD